MSSESIHERRMRRLPAEWGLDALVAMSPENFPFVSSAKIITVSLLRPRHAYAVLLANADPMLIVCAIERRTAVDESWIKNLITYREFIEIPIDVLAAKLRDAGVSSGSIGIDLDYLPASSFERLRTALPNAHFINTTEMIASVRSVKTPNEIEQLSAAAKGTHRAVLAAMSSSKPGDSERQIARRIADGIMANGADANWFIVLGAGERSAIAHAIASDYVPQPGDIVRFDVGGHFGSFYSDFARTYSAGDPTSMQRDVYRALARVQAETIAAMQAGMTGEDVFYACSDAFSRAGLNFVMPHVGHSFGYELHEAPMLRPGEKLTLKEGMTFNVEPFVFDETGAAYHLEDLVLVEPHGISVLTLGLAPPEIPSMGMP
jgi:Xaa-Pro dipeptidase